MVIESLLTDESGAKTKVNVGFGWGLAEAIAPRYSLVLLPRDMTECCLPFPSFHHMRSDSNTVTGWRVNLSGTELPPLRGAFTWILSYLFESTGWV
jgi:hypothetical protein